MRKSILASNANPTASASDRWLDLEELASFEISSEDPLYPIENALHEGLGGWKAAAPGPQTIRLTFDKPRSLCRMRLEFREDTTERTQEFAIYAVTADQARREILRQQWTFSPDGSTREIEDYPVALADVTVLELQVDPGRHDKEKMASLYSIALA
jgi:hypothetical protein